VAKTALETGRGVVDIVLEERLLSEEQVATLLKPENMTQPGRARTR
jgi:aspartate ammonia-lyase